MLGDSAYWRYGHPNEKHAVALNQCCDPAVFRTRLARLVNVGSRSKRWRFDLFSILRGRKCLRHVCWAQRFCAHEGYTKRASQGLIIFLAMLTGGPSTFQLREVRHGADVKGLQLGK